MSPAAPRPSIAVVPRCAIPGAHVTLNVPRFDVDGPRLPEVRIGGVPARIAFASPRKVRVVVPDGVTASPAEIAVEGLKARAQLDVATPVASNFHQVDNPVFDRDGNLYVTNSGARGQRVPVSVFRVRRNGTQEPFVSGIVNATSMTLGPDGRLYVSSRFEGKVYRVDADGRATPIGTDLGIACGLAFDEDGTLFVGDRSGTILRLDPKSGDARQHATLPASVAAFHLAVGPDRALYVAGPTLAPYDAIYRIEPNGEVETLAPRFGRPQGLAFDADGALHVVEAVAGSSGVFRLRADGTPEQTVAATNLVGLAFDPGGGLVVTSNDTAWRLARY